MGYPADVDVGLPLTLFPFCRNSRSLRFNEQFATTTADAWYFNNTDSTKDSYGSV